MNRNDFYKQLMSEYSFDTEKIKRNAKKGRLAGNRLTPMYIGITAAAAVVTVTVGTAIYTSMAGNSGVTLDTSGTLAALSDTERLERALDEIQRNEDSSELMDVLITFTEPLSASRVSEILTSYTDDSIPVKCLYFEDGTTAIGEEQVGKAFSASGKSVTGAVVNCVGSLMASLQSDSSIFAVEVVTDDDMGLSPINVTAATAEAPVEIGGEPIDAPANPIPERNAADETMDGVVVGTYEAWETLESLEAETFETVIGEDTEETSDALGTDTESPTPSVTAPSATTTATTAATPTEVSPSVTEENADNSLPDGAALPENVSAFSYTTDRMGAQSAFFLNNDVFFVKTADTIALYSFNGSRERLITETDCADAKICWVSESGSDMIVSGATDDRRSKLFYVSADKGTITDMSAEDVVMDGTLAAVGYNSDANLLVMNIKEDGVYYVCTASLDGSEICYIDTCFESASKVTILAAKSDTVYLAAADGQLTQIYRVSAYGGDMAVIATYDSSPKFSSNLAFTHAVVYPSDNAVIGFTEVFDPSTEAFIRTDYFNTTLTFGASKHSFTADGSVYTVSGSQLVPSGGVGVIAKIEYKKSFSRTYAATAADGAVKITESIYTDSSRSGLLTFGDLTDSASADIREAVNGAIGVNNMLACSLVKSSGITTQEQLVQAISVYYSESAAAQLKSKCSIAQLGALKYTDGGLDSINVTDTVLVINSADTSKASGILYVKAGVFNGKTAYLSYSISLVKENGAWKLDCVLG